MEWISTEKRFPKNKERVLMIGNWAGLDGAVTCTFVEKYCTDKVDFRNVFVSDNGGMYSHCEMHWMPVPVFPIAKSTERRQQIHDEETPEPPEEKDQHGDWSQFISA